MKKALIAYSQSDKVKSALIWLCQCIELQLTLPEPQRQGAQKIIQAQMEMVADEILLGLRLTDDDGWQRVRTHMDLAMVMISSKVAQEAPYHIARALSHVTGIGHRAMRALQG